MRLACLLLATAGLLPATRIEIVAGPQAPPIEKFAAAELQRYLTALFKIEAKTLSEPSGSADGVFFLGSPRTNPHVESVLEKRKFGATSEGFTGLAGKWKHHAAFVLGGGSERGTLWAVYEQVQRWGVRFQLAGDLFPPPTRFRFPQAEFTEEPALRVRQWRVVNELAFGPASWGIADHRRLIDQLAKLKFNRLLVQIWQHQPFLNYEYAGIVRNSSTMFFGARYPLSADTVGRSIFGSAKEFENPDLPFSHAPEQRLKDGIAMIRAIVEHATQRGLEPVISATLTEYPKEFAPLINGAQPIRQLGSLTITPGPQTDIDDTNLNGLASAVLGSTINTYPESRRIALGMPEWRQWTARYEDAWKYFDQRYGVGKIATLESMLEATRNRKNSHSKPERAVDEVKGDLVGLYFLDRLARDRVNEVRFQYDAVAEELFPILAAILPPGSELLNFIDYTPSRVLDRASSLAAVPAAKIPSILIYTLHDDNVGFMPQLSTKPLSQLTRELVRLGWTGFSTRYWLVGDHEPCVAYLAAAAWKPEIDRTSVYRDYARHLCGQRCADDVVQALLALEDATGKQERHGLGFSFPVPGMMLKHFDKKQIAPELLSVRDDFRRSLSHLQKAIRQHSGTRLQYLKGRLEFGIDYLDAAEFVAAAGAADARGDHGAAVAALQSGLAAVRKSIITYAAVARDQSDRGAVAILNEYAYRPIQQKLNEMEKQK